MALGFSGRYGQLEEEEYDLIDRILERIKVSFGEVRFLEIGIWGGVTATGIARKCKELGIPVSATGVDKSPNIPTPLPTPDYQYVQGDSLYQYGKIKGKYNLLLIDGCHCAIHAMCDFLNYSPFLDVNGYCMFHDTASRKDEDEQDYFAQDHSDVGMPDSVLGVRNGLKKLGLLQGYRADWKFIEEHPNETGLMGAILYQKVKEL